MHRTRHHKNPSRLACCAEEVRHANKKKFPSHLHSQTPNIANPTSRDLLSLKSCEDPLRDPLDEPVEKRAQVREDEATDVEAEELGCVPNAEFEPDVGRRSALEPGVDHLARDLVCGYRCTSATTAV